MNRDQRGPGIEFRHDDACAARILRGEQHAEARDMEQRQRAQIDVIGRERPIVQKLRAGRDQVGVREERAARPPADRGRMNHDEPSVRVGMRRRQGPLIGATEQVGVRRERTGLVPIPYQPSTIGKLECAACSNG